MRAFCAASRADRFRSVELARDPAPLVQRGGDSGEDSSLAGGQQYFQPQHSFWGEPISLHQAPQQSTWVIQQRIMHASIWLITMHCGPHVRAGCSLHLSYPFLAIRI